MSRQTIKQALDNIGAQTQPLSITPGMVSGAMNAFLTEAALKSENVQTQGSSEEAIMSQKAVTEAITAERNARMSEDASLSQRINSEASTRQQADAALGGRIDNCVEAEAKLEEEKANKDGYYGQMSVGAAENLVGDTEEDGTFTTQMTCGEVEFGSGAGQLTKVQGNGIAWNQLIKDGDFSDGIEHWVVRQNNGYSVTDNTLTMEIKTGVSTSPELRAFDTTLNNTHKYLILFNHVESVGVSYMQVRLFKSDWNRTSAFISIYSSHQWKKDGIIIQQTQENIDAGLVIPGFTAGATNDQGDTWSFRDIQVIDLSLIYGLGNEPATVEAAEAALAALVPQKPNYQYNAGELFGTKVLHLVSYGQNLLNPANGQARLAPYSYESVVNRYGIAAKAGVTLGIITFTPDATGVAETITPDSNGQFTISGAGTLSVAVSAGNLADVYVWAVYDGEKNGIENFTPFKQDAVEIKATEVYGKLNGIGEHVRVFADNVMRGAGNVHDVIDLQAMTADVNVGNIDLGSVDWTASNGGFYTPDVGAAQDVKVLCSKYAYCGSYNSFLDKGICYIYYVRIFIRDSQYTNDQAGANQLKSDMSGVFAWFQLATPLHYTDLKLSSDGGQTFRDLPTTIAVDNWGVWQQKPSDGLTPATGHDFEGIAATISTILPMDAVEILKSVQDNGIMTSDQRAQLTNILTALQTAGIIGSFTIAETPTNKVFPITVTAPENPTE